MMNTYWYDSHDIWCSGCELSNSKSIQLHLAAAATAVSSSLFVCVNFERIKSLAATHIVCALRISYSIRRERPLSLRFI